MCDCRTNFILPIPVPANGQASDFDLENTLVEGELDYLYYLSRSVPSID